MKSIDVQEEIRSFIKRFEVNTENNTKLPRLVSIEDIAEKKQNSLFLNTCQKTIYALKQKMEVAKKTVYAIIFLLPPLNWYRKGVFAWKVSCLF